MRLTLFINTEHRPNDDLGRRLAEHVEQVRLARQLGYEGISVGQHMSFGASAWFPPLEMLARLSAVDTEMALSTSMLILPWYHPLHVAQQAALLDAMCGGRLTLGLAPGWQQDESRILGLDHGKRIARFVEGVELIRRLFAEDQVTFTGKHFQADKLALALKPARKPRPPMWFGGSVTAAVERVARLSDTSLGDAWVSSAHLLHDVVIGQAKAYRAALAAAGKPPPAEVPLIRNIIVAPDRETAIREAAPALSESYRLFGKWGLFTKVVGSGKEQLELGELIRDRVIVGSPEECAGDLIRLGREAGCNRLIARMQWMGMEQRLVLRSIEMLARDVMPIVRTALAA
ncbi:MAG: LLM class flavin-dependent oxidoreductase [Betaproteobacteria bacterium]|nr:LLM class flavin-dependent oxidoreductase [Betaproteobacteria bacterium]